MFIHFFISSFSLFSSPSFLLPLSNMISQEVLPSLMMLQIPGLPSSLPLCVNAGVGDVCAVVGGDEGDGDACKGSGGTGGVGDFDPAF